MLYLAEERNALWTWMQGKSRPTRLLSPAEGKTALETDVIIAGAWHMEAAGHCPSQQPTSAHNLGGA